MGLGYIPSVQFAQFYLAEQNGYYADAGLDVEFQNKIDPDLITLVGQGSIDVGIGDGTSVIPAVSNGIPVAYVATIYGQFPNIVFAKASSGITTAADLKGKKVGIPGRYGSGWIMLQALLESAGLTTDDIEIVEYPDFTQAAAVERGAVDAATGFVNNEPVQLELHGEEASILQDRLDHAAAGPRAHRGHEDARRARPTMSRSSNTRTSPRRSPSSRARRRRDRVRQQRAGPARAPRREGSRPARSTGSRRCRARADRIHQDHRGKHDAVAAFVAATLQAMVEIKANPTVGLDAAIKAVPELANDRETQAALLDATIATWTGPIQEARGLGAIDRAGWDQSITFMDCSGSPRTRSRPTNSSARTCCRRGTDAGRCRSAAPAATARACRNQRKSSRIGGPPPASRVQSRNPPQESV